VSGLSLALQVRCGVQGDRPDFLLLVSQQ
jgi:hypothetical protein